jgi:hypothetical protein
MPATKSGKFDKLSNFDLPVSGLYLLAAPSTPAAVQGEIIDRAVLADSPLDF